MDPVSLIDPRDHINPDLLDGWGLDWDEMPKKIVNPFAAIANHPDDMDKFLLDLYRRPENFYSTAKTIFGVDLLPIQCIMLQTMWRKPFPMLIGCRGLGKSFIMGLYALMRATFIPGRKIVLTGSTFRQSKQVFEYCEKIWDKSSVLRSLYPKENRQGAFKETDKWTFRLGDSTITAIPTGNGESIRGLRANDIIVDEFKSCDPKVVEEVIIGFGSVSSAPIENVKREAKLKRMLKEGRISKEEVDAIRAASMGNQVMLSGTADFTWNHFYAYYDKYKRIIESRGEPAALKQLFGSDVDTTAITHNDFAVIRIPYNLLPKGFMDDRVISNARATTHSGRFGCEYGASFISDSQGFFRARTIANCTVSKDKDIEMACGKVYFNAVVSGDPSCKYVMGIDPASERDNLAIVLLELHPDHRRVVYVWTVNRAVHEMLKRKYESIDHDYYKFSARKVRMLMETFNVRAIIIDPEGGGRPISYALQDKKNCGPGEVPIWPAIDDKKPQDTDDEDGLHILHYAKFSNYQWLSDANHNLKFDLEAKKVLFPAYDPLAVEMIGMESVVSEVMSVTGHYDNVENSLEEIQELKEELASIVCTSTNTGREHWDTPEFKQDNGKKGRQRKDRYSALLIANALAREIDVYSNDRPSIFYRNMMDDGRGRMRFGEKGEKARGQAYSGPTWFTSQVQDFFGASDE